MKNKADIDIVDIMRQSIAGIPYPEKHINSMAADEIVKLRNELFVLKLANDQHKRYSEAMMKESYTVDNFIRSISKVRAGAIMGTRSKKAVKHDTVGKS